MSLYYFVYISSAVRLMKEPDLAELLNQSRENNSRNNITGMLLYKDGSFMQAFEGEEADVVNLHNKILEDSRHKGIITLLEGELKERQFGEWSMAFANINSLNQAELEGYSSYLKEPFTEDYFGKHPHKALKLLVSFKNSYDKR